MVDIKEHFAKQTKRYKEVVEDTNKELYENIRKELDKNLKGVVLDIGNGGIFNYNTNKLEKIFAIDLAFKSKEDGKITYIGGDARNLRKIKNNSCDRVVMQFLLHHITERKKEKTYIGLKKSLKEVNRVLKNNGELIIIEMFVNSLVEKLEDVSYDINSMFFSLINKPMLKFYSKKGLIKILNNVGFSKIITKPINIGKYIDPFGGILPGFIKIPRIFYPFKCCMIKAIK